VAEDQKVVQGQGRGRKGIAGGECPVGGEEGLKGKKQRAYAKYDSHCTLVLKGIGGKTEDEDTVAHNKRQKSLLAYLRKK
jgi:hypothetical protein